MAKIYTVSELTGYIKALLERDAVLAGVWVKGEISNFTRHSSGHMYFTLKDEQARLRCVMFRTENRLLQFQPADGMAVLVAGRVAVYPKSGEYQLYAEQMEVAGLGSLYLAFEELKKRLAAEGLFDPARKKPLPVLPKKIGVITSPTGAAVRDIIRIARRRFPSVDLLVIPAQVQGEQAAPSISQALRLANTLTGLDLLIVGRGGGSIEELWAFNEEIVARAIAASRIPVISAVGHETDFTIADMVADLRAPTPSGAAELAVPELRELRRRLLLMTERLKIAGLRVLERKRGRWTEIAGHPALLKPQRWLDIKRQRVDEAEERLARAIRNLLAKAEAVFHKELATLDALSPLATLRRGYSICRREEDGRVVREAGQVNPGEAVRVILSRGNSFVQSTERRKLRMNCARARNADRMKCARNADRTNGMELKEKSFEEAIARLEQIIEFLERGELTLEENLKLFEEGIALARHCRSQLDEAQGEVEILLGVEEGEVRTEPFQPEGEENAGEAQS